jgi:hypothetical protein
MSRASVAVDFGSTRSPVSSTKILAPALSRAVSAQVSLEGLGGGSSLTHLTGAVLRLGLLQEDL